jgi:hypothetical protein
LVKLVGKREHPRGRNRQSLRRENAPIEPGGPCRGRRGIVIAKAGKPKAKLVPYRPGRKRQGGRNLLGVTYMAEDFDAPLPPQIQKYFQ